MATLLLRTAGAAVGTALGGPLGGLIGGAVGAIGGAVVDSLLVNALISRPSTPQLDTINLTQSNEGAAVRKLWGRMRLGGNVIWVTQFQTYDTKDDSQSGTGKGFLGSSAKITHYALSFAVAFCEGGDNVTLGRIWADGNELDLSRFAYAFYNGSETQLPDSFIESVEGTGTVPAYRGLCYIVFQQMSLDDFGNRMPQITAELVRSPPIPDPDDAVNVLRAVALLPGAGEFVLGTQVYQSSDGFGAWYPENVHSPNGVPDFLDSLGQLTAGLPNCAAVSLVVTWFGSDLRAGQCKIVPKVETGYKTVTPVDWSVAGLTRSSAQLVSLIDPATLDPTGLVDAAPPSGLVPAFGGTPSDDTVVQAIQAMTAAGLRVMFYPFVMLDVPPGNGLPDPYGAAEQAPFPWRGRVTCHPAPGPARIARQDGGGGRPGRGLLRPIQPDGDALCRPLRFGRGRRRLHRRLRARGSDAGPLRPRHWAVPGDSGVEDAGRAGQGRGRAGLQGRLRGRLVCAPAANWSLLVSIPVRREKAGNIPRLRAAARVSTREKQHGTAA